MTGRDTTIQAVCAALVLVCVGASGFLTTSIASEAGRAQLVYSDRATEGDPPAVAYGIAMGAFRGLFVNYLWIRANRLKEEGKFHEAIQLSEAITRLQPRFPRVWSFHAWNMAYNISVATGNAEERWEWVRAGVELLRDEALRYNPNDVQIHKEIAWIYFHKIQGYMDDAHRYYKREHAHEWTIVMGTPPRLPDDTEEATALIVEWFRPIVEAPSTIERVIELEREELRVGMSEQALAQDPDPETSVERLIAKIESIEGLALDDTLLRVVAYQEAIENSWYAQGEDARHRFAFEEEAVNDMMQDEEMRAALERVLPHIRKRVLIDTYKMEPLRMLFYIERYGPLDWRHPATHSLYWASRGVEETLERVSTTQRSFINTDRLIIHSLQELWRTGTIYYDFLQNNEYIGLYNLHFTDAYGDMLEGTIRDRSDQVDREGRAFSFYSEGYENFMREVIRLNYRLGNLATARFYKQKTAESEWLNTNNPNEVDNWLLPLDEFVWNELLDDRLRIPYVARTEVTASLRDGILRGLLRGDRRKFDAAYAYASRVHKAYFDEQDMLTLADREANRMEEMPRDIRDVVALVIIRLITSGQVEPFQASRIYSVAPGNIQVRVYDDLMRFLAASGVQRELFDHLFEEPVGIELYREEQRMLQELDQKRDVDIDASS